MQTPRMRCMYAMIVGRVACHWQSGPRQLCMTRGILGSAAARLSPRCRLMADRDGSRGGRKGREPSSHGKLLWGQSVPDQALWWDSRSRAADCGKRAKRRSNGIEPRRTAGYLTGATAEIVDKLCREGELSEAVNALGILVDAAFPVSRSLFYTLLKTCGVKKHIALGRRVHALTLKAGYVSDTFLSNHILRMYASHGRLQEARDVFTMVVQPDAFMWSSIISAHVQQGQVKEGVQLYHDMRRSSVKPDGHVFVAALQACARSADLASGQQVHADLLAGGGQPHLFVYNCLVDMYAKCGSLADAQRVFDLLLRKDVVTWNAMMGGYFQQGKNQEALRLYSSMREEGVTSPDSVTFCCVLQACSSVGIPALAKGKLLHAQIEEGGLQYDVVVGNNLINMYVKCGSIETAQNVFDSLPLKDVVTWTALIAGYSQLGMGQEALRLFRAMEQGGAVAPNSVTFVCLLQACASVGAEAMETGKQLHAQMEDEGLQLDVTVGNSLINMYVKCGILENAQSLFDGLRDKDVVTWSALIAGYCQHGRVEEALCLYSAMREEGICPPNSVTFVCLVQACASVGIVALEKGMQLHAQVEQLGLQSDVVVANSLINMYAKCGSLQHAQSIFDKLLQKDVMSWTALIAGYTQQCMAQKALCLYVAMQQEGMAQLNTVTFVCLLHACASVGITALDTGKQLHAQIVQQGLQADVVVGNSLINMYSKCGSLHHARNVFDNLSQKDVVTWTSLIAGYSQRGMGYEALHLYSAMQDEGIAPPDVVTFVCLLQACGIVGPLALEKGQQLHAHIKELGLQCNCFVANSLVNMYANCGSLEEARSVFEGLGQKDVVTWTTLIARYSQQGRDLEAFQLYYAMQQEGMNAPNAVTFECLLQACVNVGTPALETGKELHAQIQKQGLGADLTLCNRLIKMYAKCGSLGDAQGVFDGLPTKNLVTWTALIAGYFQQGRGQEALHLHSAMRDDGIPPTSALTMVCTLQACATVGITALETGKQLHAEIAAQGLASDLLVANCLINMYAKCGGIQHAHSLLNSLPHKDVVSWTTLIAGYSQQGMVQQALDVYNAMRQEGITTPDSVTFVCLLQACGDVAALHVGRQIHAEIYERGLQADFVVAVSLIDMYSKSGSTVEAQKVFDGLPERGIVAWNALIGGYCREGNSKLVFALASRMIDDGIHPDGITFLSLLAVCSHAGLVSKGREYFYAMSRYHGITPTAEHYSCIVDLLGRAGQLDEALAVVRTMTEQPHIAVWRTLLGACQKWSAVETARHAFSEAVKLNPQDAAAYVLMSNIYTGAHMQEEAEEMQARRLEIGAWKKPGQSWWTDPDGLVHSFVVADIQHPDGEVLSAMSHSFEFKVQDNATSLTF